MLGAITLETRREAEKTVDKQQRYRQIFEVLYGRQMTAKEIAFEMYREGFIPTSERNFTAPRLTELEKDGKVKVVGKKKCEYTGRTVAVYAIKEGTQ